MAEPAAHLAYKVYMCGKDIWIPIISYMHKYIYMVYAYIPCIGYTLLLEGHDEQNTRLNQTRKNNAIKRCKMCEAAAGRTWQ
jgi:hypothetical protein